MVARLGPGAVVGNELLCDGNTVMYTIKTTAPSLLWSLSRDAFKTYLTVGLRETAERSWTRSRRRHCGRTTNACSTG